METARALGTFYTPASVAAPMCRWAIRESGDSVLDPSCGEGAFLLRAAERLADLGAGPGRLAGVELDGRALARTRRRLRGPRLERDDFFSYAERRLGHVAFDAVVGNPPYLRTQGRSPERKRLETALARRCGAALTADASAWAAFTALAAAFVKPGGRLAMVVPREALFVNYTRPLLAALERRFARVHLAPLEDARFDGALVRVAALLCEGRGPGTVRLHAATSPARLVHLPAGAAVSTRSWVWSRVPARCRRAARRALASDATIAMADVAERILIGVVTGERKYFLLSRKQVRECGLRSRFLQPALSRPSHLAGSTFTRSDLAGLEKDGEACRLLSVPTDYAGGDSALDAILARGVREGVDRNYKCRTRRPWFSVRRMLPPADLLLGYLVKRRPRLAANAAAVHSTNNLHRIFLKREWRRTAALSAAAAFNAATMLSVELLGRVGAGGVLKIEPGDGARIRLIHPRLLRRVRGWGAIDRLLREGRDDDAFAAADDLAGKAAGWTSREMALMRRAQRALRDARLRSS